MCASRGTNGANGASFRKGSFRKPQVPSLGCPRVGMPHTDEAVRGRPSGLTDEKPDFRQEVRVGCPSVQSSRHPTKRTVSASPCLSLSLPYSTSLFHSSSFKELQCWPVSCTGIERGSQMNTGYLPSADRLIPSYRFPPHPLALTCNPPLRHSQLPCLRRNAQHTCRLLLGSAVSGNRERLRGRLMLPHMPERVPS